MYDVFEQLLQKHNVTPYRVAKDAGVTQTALSNWKSGRSTPSTPTLQKIAEYFDVTVDYLMTGKNGAEDKSPLDPADRNEKDIEKNIEKMAKILREHKDSPLYLDGKPIDDTSADFLASAFESALQQLKIINRDKSNPDKDKKK